MDGQIRHIVLGVAEIADGDPHLGPAVELAESLGATLHVVHAYRLPDPAPYPTIESVVLNQEAVQQIHEGVQARLEGEVRKISESDRIVCRAVPAPADGAILKVVEDVGADLVMVGATRRGAIGRKILGTTAQRISRASGVPVLVSRRRDLYPVSRVLLTSDLSELSAKVHVRGLQILERLAAPERVELRSLLVYGSEIPFPPPVSQHRILAAAEGKLNEFLEPIRAAGTAIDARVREGDADEAIIEEAAEWPADLLILGTHGRTGASRFLIGSVAEAVLRSAPCNVLLIPAAALGSGDLAATSRAGATHPSAIRAE
ncbi:MAG: universal stress protein [Gemmatimonadota bacterium]